MQIDTVTTLENLDSVHELTQLVRPDGRAAAA